MSKITKIHTDNAPAAVGPYSQAIAAGGVLYTSGQIALDLATGEIVGDDIKAQAEQVMKNLAAVLAEAGTSQENVIKTTGFLSDMNHFAAMNSVYATFFEGACPARSAVEVARLPKDALVEIECIAVL